MNPSLEGRGKGEGFQIAVKGDNVAITNQL
jgi:hypothetical protein